MKAQYGINLNNYSLDKLKKLIKRQELIPSHRILLEKIENRFQKLDKLGLKNLDDLLQTLKDKKRIEIFSKSSGIPIDYVTVLRRYANQFVSKTVNLIDFPEVNKANIEKLLQLNIKNSKQLFEISSDREKIEELAGKSKIPFDDLEEIVKLAKLVRIWGVGAVFARIMYNSGYDTVAKFASANVEKSYKAFMETNNKGNYSSAHFSQKDIEFCIEFAKELIH